MKSIASKRQRPDGYQRLSQQATGAAIAELALIENIMREEIFHSTLDWQTCEQLVDDARQAQQQLAASRELYDLDHHCRVAMFRQMRAEAAVYASDTPANRAALNLTTQHCETAQAKLIASVDAAIESN